MKLKRSLIFLIFLSSCAVGPDFVQPKSPNVSAYTSQPLPSHIGKQKLLPHQEVSATWWQEFQSPELNQVVQKGIRHSYTLDSMKEILKEEQAVLKANQGALYPQVSLTAGAGRQKYGVALFGDSEFNIPPFTYYTFGPTATWTLDIFGKTRRTIEQQQAMVDYQYHEWQSAFLSLTGNIATTSLEIAELNDQIASTKKIIADDQQNLTLFQKAFALGAGTKIQVLTAESQLETDETLLPPYEQQLVEAKGRLNVLVGAFPNQWQPPSFTLNDFTLPKNLPLSIPSKLVRHRPDILAAEALLHAASANVGVATANLYPQITLSAATLQEALVPESLFDASSNAGNMLAGITTPIFNGGALLADRQAAIHAYKSAYDNYKQVVIQAFVQVSNVLSALQHDQQEIIQTKKALDTTTKSLELARLSYKVGSGDFLTIIDVERLYNQAQLSYVKALSQGYQDAVQLYLVLGAGSYLLNS